MPTLEAIGQELQTLKKEHTNFVVWPLQTYQQDYNKALQEVIDTFQSQKSGIQKLILQALQQKSHLKNATSFKQLIDTPTQKLEIVLDLVELFRAGYSTNVDLEIPQDIEYLKNSPIVDVNIKDAKPLFHKERDDRAGVRRRQKNGDPIINQDLGTLTIEIKQDFLEKNVPSKPFFQKGVQIVPFNSHPYALGEMQDLKYYLESDALPDQLAYHFYTNTKHDVDRFLWRGDDHKFCGINGLSIAIAKLLQDYVDTGTDTYDQRMEFYVQDRVAKSPVIQEFNTIFQDYLSIDVESKKGHIIYKLGPKLKQ